MTVVCCYASYSTPAGPSGMGASFGKRSAPGLAFIKNKKKKTANLVKDFKFSSADDEGQMVTVFPISINLSEISEKFGQLSVPIIIICRAAGSGRGGETDGGGCKGATYHGFL